MLKFEIYGEKCAETTLKLEVGGGKGYYIWSFCCNPPRGSAHVYLISSALQPARMQQTFLRPSSLSLGHASKVITGFNSFRLEENADSIERL